MRPVVCFVVAGFWGVRSGASQGLRSGVGSGVGGLGGAGAAGEDAEVGFDVLIAGEDAIVVEIDVIASGAACTGEHGEEVDAERPARASEWHDAPALGLEGFTHHRAA